jgi:hypothetical protein
MATDQKYLMIQNPGILPPASVGLFGASTKRGEDKESGVIGTFGSGFSMSIGTLLRNSLPPIMFSGNLKMEFTTRTERVKSQNFARVQVKFGGKDEDGKSRSNTEDLGFVLDYGSHDWDNPELALREFVSNALDEVTIAGQKSFRLAFLADKGVQDEYDLNSEQTKEYRDALKIYRLYGIKQDFQNVVIEVVNENQVRAKAGHTRIFVPMNKNVEDFHKNLGKWFLHFSEPDSLNKEILPKNGRNLGTDKVAVIYRRGVRVREIQYTTTQSLFDYNFQEIPLDESRKIDDWRVKTHAGQALARAKKNDISAFWQSFYNNAKCWEHEFSQYSLTISGHTPKEAEEIRKNWSDTFEAVVGSDAVVATKNGGEIAARKGYKVVTVSDEIYEAVKNLGVKTPDKVLTYDEKEGRVITDPTPDALCAVEFLWKVLRKHNLLNGKEYPKVKGFHKAMEASSQTLGFYRNGTVYLNNELGTNASENGGWKQLTHQLIQTALEEICHHVTQEADFSRGFQDFAFNLTTRLAMSAGE